MGGNISKTSVLEPTITERRRLTRNRIYRCIYDAPEPVSQQQIMLSEGVSLPTVHQNITELASAGLIFAKETQKSTGGRPATGYCVVPDIRHAIGIAVSHNHLRFLATDLKQERIGYKRVDVKSIKVSDLGLRLSRELEKFIDENSLDRKKLLGVGVTIPGLLDEDNERVILSPSMKISDLDLSVIRDNIDYPLYIKNDSTCAGYAEYFAASAENRQQDFIYLFMETGVGGAIFIDGRSFGGTSERSAEFGHMCVETGGLMCNCGKRGCLEAYCGAFRYSRDINCSVEEFFAGLEEGNRTNVTLWDDVLDHLATGLCNLRMAFDLPIVIGGMISEYLPPYLDEIRKRVAARDPFGEDTSYIRLGSFPREAGMMGAAWHLTDRFISQI